MSGLRTPGPSPRVVTRRLVLRCWYPEDANALKAAIDASLGHLQAWMGWARAEPSELAVVEARLARMRDEFEDGLDWSYAMFDRTEKRLLGGLGLHRRAEPDTFEIGYWLRGDATGHGYATEATQALTRVGFNDVGAERLEIRCDPRNARSAAVPARLGYRHTRTIEQEMSPDGAPRDTMVWELTRPAFGRGG